MATKPTSEPNKFIALRKTIASLSKDIAFLSRCKSSNLTPKSHRIKINTSINFRRIKSLENEVISHSIRSIRAKLDQKTLEAYHLHLKLARQYPMQFPLFLTKVKVAEECESERKRKSHDKKFRKLKEQKPKKAPISFVHRIDNFVVNQSSQSFTGQQMDLLNKGLKYAIHSEPQVQELVIGLESGINAYSPSLPITAEQRECIRATAAETIKEDRLCRTKKRSAHEEKVIKELVEKPVYYIKADKGNALVIMDKVDYDSRMADKIRNGPYRKLRNDPLPDLVKRVDKIFKECKQVIGNSRLKVSNPILPRIKGLPKIHKPGYEMREIVSAEMSPTHRMAKWLVEQFQSMEKQFETKSVKNSKEFAQHLQTIGQLEEDEIMVSFDVKALFPSIPVKEAITLVENWLGEQHTGQQGRERVKQYVKLTKLCMEENYFTFRGDYYKQLKGAPMGNPLSPFISEMFMAKLESELVAKKLMPRFWRRYVDDIFAITRRQDLESTLKVLNGLHKNIEFTFEIEKEGKLSFLDILLTRKQNALELEIYRKPTDTSRVIPSTSNHSYQHKMASFNHMIHRMLTLPISQEGLEKESKHILEVARLNGYPKNTIIKLINKRKKTLQRKTLTRLITDQQPRRRVVLGFDRISKSLGTKLRKHRLDMTYSSRNNQLRTLLGSTKDSIDQMAKSGVYKITCSHCNKVYIGQTRRNIETRLKEHLKEAELAEKKNSTNFRSKVAEHIVLEKHAISKENITIVNHIRDARKLDVAESIEIYKTPADSLLNRDQGNGYSSLFKFIRKYQTTVRDFRPTGHTILEETNGQTVFNDGLSRNPLNINLTRPTDAHINKTGTSFTQRPSSIKRTIVDFFSQSCTRH